MTLYELGRGSSTGVDHTRASCGLSALWDLYTDPAEIVGRVLNERAGEDKVIREAFVVFSDIADRGHHRGGQILADYIRRNDLGTLMETESRMNPNTGNMIKVWVWSPQHESLDPKNKYLNKRGYKRAFRKEDRRFSRYVAPDSMGRVLLDDGETL